MVDEVAPRAEDGKPEDEIERARSTAANFARSEVFSRTFHEGMRLVEETAEYLDGGGREVSKGLGRNAALAYAGASMRLTTELMQIASWLLVLRAVREGEMPMREASQAKYRLPARREERPDDAADDDLPPMLVELIAASNRLYERIGRLDEDLFADGRTFARREDAAAQQEALTRVFGR